MLARLTFIALSAFLLFYYLIPLTLPLPPPLTCPPQTSPHIFARDGTPLYHAFDDSLRAAAPLRPEQLPNDLRLALLAAEDRRFYAHGGIDPLALARAALSQLSPSLHRSGASTLSQQLVKLATPQGRRNLATKFAEKLRARSLELRRGKDQILADYLNRAPFPAGHVGVHAASLHLFDRHPAGLSLSQCATLAGLPQAPSRLNPLRDPDAALARRDHVLNALQHHDLIPLHRIAAARSEPLAPTLFASCPLTIAPHAALRLVPLASRSPRLISTIDPQLQILTQESISSALARLRTHNVRHAAAVILDNSSLDVLALVGSPCFSSPDAGHFDGTWLPRSAGSSLKPLTYALAFDHGLSPAELIPDVPATFDSATGPFSPQNYDRLFHGPVTPRQALANSLNVSAVQVLHQIGGTAALHGLLTSRLHFSSLSHPPDHYGLGLTIGNAPVRLIELAAAYACLARGGSFLPPRLVLHAPSPEPTQVFSPQAAYLVADILADPMARGQAFGPRSPLRLPFPCAVKTGTSTGYRDNWTIGFTRDHTVAVWVGNFDNSPMRQISGVTGAAPIFRSLMLKLASRHAPAWPTPPPGLTELSIDRRTGHRDPPPHAMPHTTRELFPSASLPQPASPSDYDHAGRALLPPLYSSWLRGPQNPFGDTVALAIDAPATQQPDPAPHRPPSLALTSPFPGATYIIDADLPHSGRHLPLRTSPPRHDITWASPTLHILFDERSRPYALLHPGQHQITATDPTSGQTILATIEVTER